MGTLTTREHTQQTMSTIAFDILKAAGTKALNDGDLKGAVDKCVVVLLTAQPARASTIQTCVGKNKIACLNSPMRAASANVHTRPFSLSSN